MEKQWKITTRTGIHRNHHFDTIERLHPLNTGDAPLHPVIGLDYSSFYEGLQSSLFFHEKREITAPEKLSNRVIAIALRSELLQRIHIFSLHNTSNFKSMNCSHFTARFVIFVIIFPM